MLIKKNTEVVIDSDPEAIWKYAYDPKNWTASNPGEHRGLKFFNERNRPETGTEFYQKEYVAGLYADLRGQILWAEPAKVCAWTGVAKYRVLGGLIHPRIPEGGVVRIEKVAGGYKVSHNVFMDFPGTITGKLMLWMFKNVLGGEQAVYDHTYKELVYFKNQLEKAKPLSE
jgi:hypothetical protein